MKISKWDLKHKEWAYPERQDVVSGNFSIAQFFEDACAYDSGVYQGYFACYENINLYDLFYGDALIPIDEVEWQDLVSKIGDLNEEDYSKEMYLLLKDFRLRVLAGEDIDVVDRDISKKMEEVATRNEDGSHNMKMYGKERSYERKSGR